MVVLPHRQQTGPGQHSISQVTTSYDQNTVLAPGMQTYALSPVSCMPGKSWSRATDHPKAYPIQIPRYT
jgi:hypothetical protein